MGGVRLEMLLAISITGLVFAYFFLGIVCLLGPFWELLEAVLED